MLFNSIVYAIFLPLVFAAYWLIGSKRIRTQNLLILAASYVFYGWWDYRFLALIFASSYCDYKVGLKMMSTESKRVRRGLLLLSISFNLGMLGVFKYYNFFIDNLERILPFPASDLPLSGLNIVLPVGISFYTFQTLSYTIDLYRKKIEPETNFLNFMAFVAFFPQLVAGPIERASSLLPQFKKARSFDYDQARDGMRMILWGLFKKVAIADVCAIYVNSIFENYTAYGAPVLILALVLFSFQIYGDFSGYADIAIGTAKLFGFNLMRNFAYPYFSRDMAEFWRRWHISLMTWIRDYLYIPLGGNRCSMTRQVINVFIIFGLSGLWHGANWTYIIWGLLNAVYFVPLMVLNISNQHKGQVAENSFFPSPREALGMFITFAELQIAWIIFRSPSMSDAWAFLTYIVTGPFSLSGILDARLIALLVLIIIFVCWEWCMRRYEHGLHLDHFATPLRWTIYLVMVWLIFQTYNNETQFIYFQF